MTKSLLTGMAVCAALAIFAGNANAYVRKAHARAYTQAAERHSNPAVRGEYIMNGNFDWIRRGEPVPWYGRGYSDDCVAWTQNAYHYACDPNGRY